MNKEKIDIFVDNLNDAAATKVHLFMEIDDKLQLLQSSAECTRFDIQNALRAECIKRKLITE